MVFDLRCVQCGAALELPYDPHSVHIDCPYCGRDNVLPPHIVQARQREYAMRQQAAYQQQQAHIQQQRLAHARESQKRSSRLVLIILALVFGLPLLGFAGCVALGIYASNEEEAEQARVRDPTINGRPRVLAAMERLRADECEHIVIQPEAHRGAPKELSVDMKEGGDCLHVLAATGVPGNQLSLSVTTSGFGPTSPPPPASELNYRYCAPGEGNFRFEITSSAREPFTTAAVDCPRKPEEGGRRSEADDPVKTGKQRTSEWMKELTKAGCNYVVDHPKVQTGNVSYTVTSQKHGPCYNFLAVSHFSDVKLTAKLETPLGESLPVPAPTNELRIIYCPTLSGTYKLELESSTSDHYTVAAIDCPRFSREGLSRERALKREIAGK